MRLTEDRWVQIPSELLLIPIFSVIQLKGMSSITDLDTGHTQVMTPVNFSDQKELPYRWANTLFFNRCSDFSGKFILQQPQNLPFPPMSYFTKGSLPVALNLFLCNILLIFSANTSLTETIILLPLSVWLQLKVFSLNKYFQSYWITIRSLCLLCVCSGNAFAKVWMSSRESFLGETPSCTRAS